MIRKDRQDRFISQAGDFTIVNKDGSEVQLEEEKGTGDKSAPDTEKEEK